MQYFTLYGIFYADNLYSGGINLEKLVITGPTPLKGEVEISSYTTGHFINKWNLYYKQYSKHKWCPNLMHYFRENGC